MVDYFFWIVSGISIGLLARSVLPQFRLGNVAADVGVGLVGAIAGGCFFHYFLGDRYGALAGSTLSAIIGAIVLLSLMRFMFTKAKTS